MNEQKNRIIKILFFETDEFMKMLLRDSLLIHGGDNYKLEIVDNLYGVNKFLKRQRNELDVIIMEVMAADEQSGANRIKARFDFIKKLKADPETKHIKILIFSKYKDKEIKDKALKLGADKFLVKGEEFPRELVEKIFQMCK